MHEAKQTGNNRCHGTHGQEDHSSHRIRETQVPALALVSSVVFQVRSPL
jgi:hypothetical protein